MSWKPITQPMPVNTPVLLKQQRDGYEPFVIIGIYAEQYTLEVQEVCDFDDADEICDWADYSNGLAYCPAGFYEQVMNMNDQQYIIIDSKAVVIEWMEVS